MRRTRSLPEFEPHVCTMMATAPGGQRYRIRATVQERGQWNVCNSFRWDLEHGVYAWKKTMTLPQDVEQCRSMHDMPDLAMDVIGPEED